MSLIKESQWGLVDVHTWGDLEENKWDDFYLALAETETNMTTKPIVIEHVGTEFKSTAVIDVQGVAIEYSSIVFRTKTDMNIDIVSSDRNYLSNMLKYLPLYERKSGTFIEILNAYGYLFVDAENRLNVLERNLFIDTAIETLSLYERELNISPSRKLEYNQRREQISSRLRAMVDQTTEETIKSVAASYAKGEIKIDKTDEPGVFEIEFISEIGIPDNMSGLKKALDIVMPAHLELTYKFTFNTWQDLELSWSDATKYTWNELRENEVSA